jgi:hypothetical protein
MDQEKLRFISANLEQAEKDLRELRDKFPKGGVPEEQFQAFWDSASMWFMLLPPDLRELVEQLRE